MHRKASSLNFALKLPTQYMLALSVACNSKALAKTLTKQKVKQPYLESLHYGPNRISLIHSPWGIITCAGF